MKNKILFQRKNHSHQKALGHQIDPKNQQSDELTQTESGTYGLNLFYQTHGFKMKREFENVF